jgi:hypothetical protein
MHGKWHKFGYIGSFLYILEWNLYWYPGTGSNKRVLGEKIVECGNINEFMILHWCVLRTPLCVATKHVTMTAVTVPWNSKSYCWLRSWGTYLFVKSCSQFRQICLSVAQRWAVAETMYEVQKPRDWKYWTRIELKFSRIQIDIPSARVKTDNINST